MTAPLEFRNTPLSAIRDLLASLLPQYPPEVLRITTVVGKTKVWDDDYVTTKLFIPGCSLLSHAR
jgi:hypothetical protein